MKLHLSRRRNGLYMLTRYIPIREQMGDSKRDDLYVRPGDPIGVAHLCPEMVHAICGELPRYWCVTGETTFEMIDGPIELERSG